MASPLPPGPWARIVAYYTNGEKQSENIYWYKASGPIPTDFDISFVTAGLSLQFQTNYKLIMGTNCEFNGIDCYFNNGTYTVSGESTSVAAGVIDGGTLPNEDAAIVTFSAGVGTRVGVGRSFLGCVPESFVTESKLNDTGAAAYATFAAFIMTSHVYTTMTWVPAIWSRKTTSLDPTVFNVVRTILGHRKRRRPRR